jgi:hypothetical protein
MLERFALCSPSSPFLSLRPLPSLSRCSATFQLLSQLYRDNVHSLLPSMSRLRGYVCGGHMLIADTIINLLFKYQVRGGRLRRKVVQVIENRGEV